MIALWPLHLLWPFNDHDFVLSWTSDFDYVVLAVVIVATGVSETDGFQHRAPGIIAGAVLLYEHGRCISFYLVKGQDVSEGAPEIRTVC